MAVVITVPNGAADVPGVMGNMRYRIVTVTLSSSYPTNGESLTATDLGFERIAMVVVGSDANTGGYIPQYDYTAEKLLMYEAGADAAQLDEVANTTDLSAEVVRIAVYGR